MALRPRTSLRRAGRAIRPANRAALGSLSADLGNDSADLMIAATALERGLTVVTRNVSDFEPSGVAVLDPFSRSRPACSRYGLRSLRLRSFQATAYVVSISEPNN